MDLPHFEQELSGLISQAADAHPVFQRPPKTQREEADEDVRLDPALQMVIDRAQSKVALEVAECGFRFRELDVPAPEFGGVFAVRVGAQDVCAVGFLRPFELPGLLGQGDAARRVLFVEQYFTFKMFGCGRIPLAQPADALLD